MTDPSSTATLKPKLAKKQKAKATKKAKGKGKVKQSKRELPDVASLLKAALRNLEQRKKRLLRALKLLR